MYRNQIVLLYAFVALAILSGLGRGIEHIAYAQLWSSSPNIQIQNSNNFQTYNNKNSIQPNSSNCITTTAMSDIHDRDVSSALSGSAIGGLLSSSKISANCHGKHFFNSCQIKIKETLRHASVIKPTSTTITTNIDTNIDTIPTKTKTTTSSVQKICGTEHDDYIIGTTEDDIILGLRGNDVMMAL